MFREYQCTILVAVIRYRLGVPSNIVCTLAQKVILSQGSPQLVKFILEETTVFQRFSRRLFGGSDDLLARQRILQSAAECPTRFSVKVSH